MAGLGEVCSHIASILFYLEAVVKIQGTSPTCTQEKCQWIIPSFLKNAEYLPTVGLLIFEDIKFRGFNRNCFKQKISWKKFRGYRKAAKIY